MGVSLADMEAPLRVAALGLHLVAVVVVVDTAAIPRRLHAMAVTLRRVVVVVLRTLDLAAMNPLPITATASGRPAVIPTTVEAGRVNARRLAEHPRLTITLRRLRAAPVDTTLPVTTLLVVGNTRIRVITIRRVLVAAVVVAAVMTTAGTAARLPRGAVLLPLLVGRRPLPDRTTTTIAAAGIRKPLAARSLAKTAMWKSNPWSKVMQMIS